MLPPKDQFNEQMGERYRNRSDVAKVQPGTFGPPDFGDEETAADTPRTAPAFFNPQALEEQYRRFESEDDNSDIDDIDNDEDDDYEPYLEEALDGEEPTHQGFTPPPPWQGVQEYPNPASLRQPNAEFIRDEPIFKGGPARSEVNAWKKQFEGDNHTVHLSELDEENIFIWRTLARTEYREIMALPNTDPLQREEIICEVCVLYPPNYNFSSMATRKAGIPAVVAEQIMHESGFKKPSPPIRL